MSLSIIGAGLGRTGTLSLKRALEELGFGPCYHGLDSNIGEIERIYSALNQDPPDWDGAFGTYRSAVDWPVNLIYRALSHRYPSAKIILTVREPDGYFRSIQALVAELQTRAPFRGEVEFGRRFTPGSSVRQIYDNPHDHDSVVAAFQRYNAEVHETTPSERLLVFDVKQGWQPLCDFLSVPVPQAPFPHANSPGELSTLFRRLGCSK